MKLSIINAQKPLFSWVSFSRFFYAHYRMNLLTLLQRATNATNHLILLLCQQCAAQRECKSRPSCEWTRVFLTICQHFTVRYALSLSVVDEIKQLPDFRLIYQHIINCLQRNLGLKHRNFSSRVNNNKCFIWIIRQCFFL